MQSASTNPLALHYLICAVVLIHNRDPMLRLVLSLSLFAGFAAAQSPLTTLFLSNNNGAIGGGVYFDLTVAVPIVVTGIEVNTVGSGSIDIYTTPGTRNGVQTNQSAWTLVSSGTVTGAVNNVPAPLTSMAPFALAPGSYGIALAGVGVAHYYTNGTGANQTYTTAELQLNAGEASNAAFAAPLFTPRVVNCAITYTVGSGGGSFAARSNYGSGCQSAPDVPFYEFFGAGTFDLANSSMSLIHTGSGYLGLPGITSFRSTALANTLALTDDSEVNVPLSAPLRVGASGSTMALTVCSHGYVSVASGNGVGFTPTSPAFLTHPQTGWYCWHDYNPAAVGGGQVKFEEAGGVAYVTWDGVYDFGSTTPNTFQMQFDLASGNVHMLWQSMSTGGNGFLVGFHEGGVSADPGPLDLSVAIPATFLSTFHVLPLSLTASARPVIGNNVNLTVSNIPGGSPFGVVLIGFAKFDPGIQLPILPLGCVQHNDGLASTLFTPAGSSASVQLGFLNPVANFPGLRLQLQSAVYVGNPLALTSNGVELVFGTQ